MLVRLTLLCGVLGPGLVSGGSLVGQEISARTDMVEVILDTKPLQEEIFFIGETEKNLNGRVSVRLASKGRVSRPFRLQTILLSPKGEILGRCASEIVEAVPGQVVRTTSICSKGGLSPRDPEMAVSAGEVMTLELEPGESAARAAGRVFPKVEYAGAVVIQAVPADGKAMSGKAAVLYLKYPIEHG